jgi:F420-0:gamma-glutamyl ligase-like protein
MAKVLAVNTCFWRTGQDYLRSIACAIEGKIRDGDFVVVSEKALSTALNNLIDESLVKPGFGAKVIARPWMRIAWGYCLVFLCHFDAKLIRVLREYPYEMGSRHKQVALQNAGLLGALMFGSEGGIDGTNLPYSYVALPLKSGKEIAEGIRAHISSSLGNRVFVMIADTDKTYSVGGFHFTPRPSPIKGVHSLGGVASYVVGRFLKLRRRATPIAVAGCQISVEQALKIAEVANRARGYGAGKTVWAMAERFGVGINCVSWEMLETVKHKPIVIVRI